MKLEPHIRKEKMLQMKTRQSLTLSGPKNVGIKSKVVRAQETMLLTGRDVSRPSLDKSPLNSSPRLSEKKHTQKISENVYPAVYLTLCSQLWSKG
jgi:hypothetical protein